MSRVVEVTELALRDGHQSLLATRMAMEDMVAGLRRHRSGRATGASSAGAGPPTTPASASSTKTRGSGCAPFASSCPIRRLQMLLRGQNLLGYRHYEDTVVDRFVDKSAENGMDVFRVFDALNDVRNLRRALDAVRRTGKHAEGTICYTISPLHTVEQVRRDGPAAPRPGLRLDLHQGHGGALAAAAGLRPRAGHQGEVRRGHARPRACPFHHGRHDGQPDEGDRGRAPTSWTRPSRRSASGPGHNPTEALVEMLEGHRLHHPAEKDRLLKIKDHFAKVRPEVRRVRIEDSSASRPRSSTARSPAA